MPPEMQIVKDIADMFTTYLSRPMRFHFGDVLEKAEVFAALEAGIGRWLVPVSNDKTDDLAAATESLIQTFSASLVVVARKASDAVEALIDTLLQVYVTNENVAGVHDAPREIDTIRFHRFEPQANQLRMSAQNWEGAWLVEQPVLISAEKIV